MADDSPRRCGRPPLDPGGPPLAPVQVKLTAKDFDQAWATARQRGESIHDVIRRGLKHDIERTSQR